MRAIITRASHLRYLSDRPQYADEDDLKLVDDSDAVFLPDGDGFSSAK